MPLVIKMKANRIPQALDEIRDEISTILRETAVDIQGNIQLGMSGAHGGRLYTHGSVVHQSSAPGEMPAIDESLLFGSIAVDAEPGALEASVYTGAEYAPHLEFGTIYMQARPFMVPATEDERAGFEGRFSHLV
jgi:hypothetical protein